MFKKCGMLLMLALLIIGCGHPEKEPDIEDKVQDEVLPPEPELQIIDVDSKTRPIAVMIDNHPNARPNHTGLQDAYIIYEMIVEGGFSRYMALFKDQETEKIGPVRSARHYYLDYALENDAIYAHFGWSPKSETDIRSLQVNNINGLVSSAYWRDNTLFAPHNAFTSIENLKNDGDRRNYNRDTNQENLFEYSIDEVDLTNHENKEPASSVTFRYSSNTVTSYIYNSDEGVYERSVNNVNHVDRETKQQYTAKNIIAYKLNTTALDNTGRRDIKNIGSGDGYFISNGVAIPIKWSKNTRTGQTVYTYENGERIILNDGNTYIQILPLSGEIKITE